MKERSILFSAPMVRAILKGRKTQTRLKVFNKRTTDYQSIEERDDGTPWPWRETEDAQDHWYPCPYGQPGDRLWVRETFAIVPRTAYACSDGVQQTLRPDDPHDAAIYRADWSRSNGGIQWRPSIHMPSWASRITLEVTGVRVELLQDISEVDAISEGVRQMRDGSECWVGREGPRGLVTPWPTAREAFRDLWQSINGPDSWTANPWVFVIEFQRVLS